MGLFDELPRSDEGPSYQSEHKSLMDMPPVDKPDGTQVVVYPASFTLETAKNPTQETTDHIAKETAALLRDYKPDDPSSSTTQPDENYREARESERESLEAMDDRSEKVISNSKSDKETLANKVAHSEIVLVMKKVYEDLNRDN